ncbi:uridine kinase [Kitasatospora sp. NPDC056138]|uniref:uridine kinase family protein n=1 Tax=Kitasatospora sp. NPDC056138 TaxID=3345724 RepID=UPI0035D5D3E3
MLLTLSGGAGAGKTTLAEALAEDSAARERPATVLHGDDYYVTEPAHGGIWTPDESGTLRLDVGDPRSVDSRRLDSDTASALAASPLVIVEGLFAFRVRPPAGHHRFDVFVDLPADLRLARKIRRKCLDDGFPLDVLLANYLNHRRAAHTRHVEPARHLCDLVVDGAQPSARTARRIQAHPRWTRGD